MLPPISCRLAPMQLASGTMHLHSIPAACSCAPMVQALAATLLLSLWACWGSCMSQGAMPPAAAPEREATAAASPPAPEPQPAPTPAVETQLPPEEPAASSLDMPMPEWAPPGMSHAGDFPKVSPVQPPAGLTGPEWAPPGMLPVADFPIVS